MNNKIDEEIEAAFDKVYAKYKQILLKAANAKKSENLYSYQARFFKAMDEGANAFKTATKSIVDKYIGTTEESVSMALQSFGAKYGGSEIKLTTYVRMAEMLTQSVQQYRDSINEKIIEREKEGKVTTVGDLQGIIQEDLEKGEGTSIKYKNGTNMPVGKYAAMLARTTRAETDNLAMLQQALKEGIDLVKCGTVAPTCDICSVYQGRVYSISGKDSRFPALYKTAFQSGYSIIHPNCRHSWSPYREEMYTEEQREKDKKQSNRSFKPDTDSRDFQQAERLRKQYAQGQAKMRQWNAELVEYERMKAYYKLLGEEPPYKTLGGFRRAKRAGSESYKEARKTFEKRLTKEKENNIIKEQNGFGGEHSVAWSVINTKDYQDKIIALTDKKVLGKAVYKVAKTILEHRQGTAKEDLYLIDARTGAVAYKDITTDAEMGVIATEELMSLLSKKDGKDLIIVHNHPKNGYPSSSDFNALYENAQIKYGIIIGHKGTIYKYTAPKQKMQDIDIDAKVIKLMRKGWSEQNAINKAYKELGKVFGFVLEVINNGN